MAWPLAISPRAAAAPTPTGQVPCPLPLSGARYRPICILWTPPPQPPLSLSLCAGDESSTDGSSAITDSGAAEEDRNKDDAGFPHIARTQHPTGEEEAT